MIKFVRVFPVASIVYINPANVVWVEPASTPKQTLIMLLNGPPMTVEGPCDEVANRLYEGK